MPSHLFEMYSSPETSLYKGLVFFNQAVSLPLESLFWPPSPHCALFLHHGQAVALHRGMWTQTLCMIIQVLYVFRSSLQRLSLMFLTCIPQNPAHLVAIDVCFQRDNKVLEDQLKGFLSLLYILYIFPFSSIYSSIVQQFSMDWAEMWEMARCRSVSSFVLKERNENFLHPAHVLHSRTASRGLLRIPQRS